MSTTEMSWKFGGRGAEVGVAVDESSKADPSHRLVFVGISGALPVRVKN